MRKNLTNHYLPEIVFSSSDAYTSRQISVLVKDGHLRKLLPRVYTSNMEDLDEIIVKRNLWQIIAHLFPGAILSHRSAIEFTVSEKGNIYLTGPNKRVYQWPGVNVRMTVGPDRLQDDYPLYDNLHASSLERAVLENLMPARTVAGERRTLQQEKIEERLLQELNTKGEKGLNQLRDRAREIATAFGWGKAFTKLNQLVGSLLSSRSKNILKSPIALARALGEPYDAGRIDLFQKLITVLKNTHLINRPEKTKSQSAYRNLSFFESYFSNYIEGTTFEVQEAIDIIYNNKIIPNRTDDSHDIIDTYQIVSNPMEMNQIPDSPEEFLDTLARRHKTILQGRADKNPGAFKTKANRAGDTHFVSPEMVKGTLKQGFKFISSLTQPLKRALYIMFLVSEVHPFDDGNGRLARIMMNAELVHADTTKLIIPTVYRDDYILNLKKLTNQADPKGYIRMMDRAHAFSHWLQPDDMEVMKDQLKKSNAFRESSEAVLRFGNRK